MNDVLLSGGVFYSWRQLDSDNSRGWGTPDLVSTPSYSCELRKLYLLFCPYRTDVRVLVIVIDLFM